MHKLMRAQSDGVALRDPIRLYRKQAWERAALRCRAGDAKKDGKSPYLIISVRESEGAVMSPGQMDRQSRETAAILDAPKRLIGLRLPSPLAREAEVISYAILCGGLGKFLLKGTVSFVIIGLLGVQKLRACLTPAGAKSSFFCKDDKHRVIRERTVDLFLVSNKLCRPHYSRPNCCRPISCRRLVCLGVCLPARSVCSCGSLTAATSPVSLRQHC